MNETLKGSASSLKPLMVHYDTFFLESSGKSQFHGMRVCDTIPSSLAKSYFRVELDGKKNIFTNRQPADF